MKKPVLVVMAAGMGSRYGGLKQIDPVGRHGQLIIDYSIFDARRAGFDTVVFIIKREIEEEFRTAIGDRLSKVMDVRYAYQQLELLPPGYAVPSGRIKPWGTAHAVLCAAPEVDGPFAVINADDYYGPQAFRLVYDYLLEHPDQDGCYEFVMVGYHLKNTVTEHGHVARGVCRVDENGYLTDITERTHIEKDGEDARYTEDGGATWEPLSGSAAVSMNLWGFTRGFLDEIRAGFPAFLDRALAENPLKGEYFLPSVVSRLIGEGRARVKVLESLDKWYGVTYQEDKPVVVEAIRRKTREGLYPDHLWEVCPPAEAALEEVLAAYDFGGPVTDVQRYGQGHINDTFCVTANTRQGSRRFILQRINTQVFKRPDQLMENIVGVTNSLRQAIQRRGGDPAREAITVLPARSGEYWRQDGDGGAWRVYLFVEGSICLQMVEKPEQFYASAKAFGEFQRLLGSYPAHTLHETIEKFHDTRARLANFERAVEADSQGRAAGCRREIEFVLARRADCSLLMDALEQGRLPLRVTHNDTKLNNVLLDQATGQALCIIDLDTVMPGLSLNDYGDSIRFGANHCAEDEQDLSKVNFDLPLYETYTRGYLEAAGEVLTPAEKELLPWGAKLMTLECGMRFLTDYLEGDVYFHTHRPGQNLDRARTQFKLVADMESHWEEMARIAAKYF